MKSIFTIFKELPFQQMKQTFLEDESQTLSEFKRIN